MVFPDPMNHCIGFLIKPPTVDRPHHRADEEYKSKICFKKNFTLDTLMTGGATGSLP